MNSPTAGATSSRRRRSAIFFVLGILLTAAALWFALGGFGGDSMRAAVRHARTAPVPLLAAALLLPPLNWLLTSAYFFVLTRRYGRVTAAEMTSLIGAAWLLNYAPLKPGLFGRVAYHKSVNGIDVVDSVRVLAAAIASGVCAVLLLLFIAVLTPRSASPGTALAAISLPLFACALAAPSLRTKGNSWRIPTVLGLRYLDALVWTARYAVIFAVIGKPVTISQAAAIAGVSQLVLVIPFAGNGLGLREWAVGLTAASLPDWFGAPLTAQAAAVGVSADLLNRAAELCGAVVVGVPCLMFVARRLHAAKPRPDAVPR